MKKAIGRSSIRQHSAGMSRHGGHSPVTFLWITPIMLLGTLCWLAPLVREACADETNLFGAHMQQPEIVIASGSNGVLELTCKVGFLGGC